MKSVYAGGVLVAAVYLNVLTLVLAVWQSDAAQLSVLLATRQDGSG